MGYKKGVRCYTTLPSTVTLLSLPPSTTFSSPNPSAPLSPARRHPMPFQTPSSPPLPSTHPLPPSPLLLFPTIVCSVSTVLYPPLLFSPVAPPARRKKRNDLAELLAEVVVHPSIEEGVVDWWMTLYDEVNDEEGHLEVLPLPQSLLIVVQRQQSHIQRQPAADEDKYHGDPAYDSSYACAVAPPPRVTCWPRPPSREPVLWEKLRRARSRTWWWHTGRWIEGRGRLGRRTGGPWGPATSLRTSRRRERAPRRGSDRWRGAGRWTARWARSSRSEACRSESRTTSNRHRFSCDILRYLMAWNGHLFN